MLLVDMCEWGGGGVETTDLMKGLKVHTLFYILTLLDK